MDLPGTPFNPSEIQCPTLLQASALLNFPHLWHSTHHSFLQFSVASSPMPFKPFEQSLQSLPASTSLSNTKLESRVLNFSYWSTSLLIPKFLLIIYSCHNQPPQNFVAFSFSLFWPCSMAQGISVPSGIKPVPPEVEVQSLSYPGKSHFLAYFAHNSALWTGISWESDSISCDSTGSGGCYPRRPLLSLLYWCCVSAKSSAGVSVEP